VTRTAGNFVIGWCSR